MKKNNLSLINYQRVINIQAKTKKWNDSNWWLIKKLEEEFKELKKAVKNNHKPHKVTQEVSDMMIVLLQISKKKAPHRNPDTDLQSKIKSNWKNKKKTWDSKTKRIVRK